jgi:hypothetical protein
MVRRRSPDSGGMSIVDQLTSYRTVCLGANPLRVPSARVRAQAIDSPFTQLRRSSRQPQKAQAHAKGMTTMGFQGRLAKVPS